MSDSEPTPDDLLVSAVLDGVASADEAERVASDPRLTARLAQFRAVAEAVGGPVPLVDTAVRDAHLARARAALQSGEQARAALQSGEHARAALQSGDVGSPPPPPPPSPPPAPPAAPLGPTATTTPAPVDLATARAQRRRPRSTVILSVAAAVLLVIAAGAVLVRLGSSTSTGGGDAEVAATVAEEPEAADSAESGGDAGNEFAPAPDTGTASSGDATAEAPTSTVVPSGVDPSLPSLGSFTKADDLAARVRGELTLEPQPTGLVADESCGDDFGVEVVLLGRASVDGDEGLVYVEAAPGTPRRLWLVDPGTVGADDACRQVVPVQTL